MENNPLFMQRCFDLALLAVGNVAPNPMVGAVLTVNGEIVAEGYHQQYGHAHAEVNCINNFLEKEPNAETLLKKVTLYVNLEPCSHTGKTPPCADLIIKYQIPHVVISNRDPFSRVNGTGIEKLKNAGIKVTEGVLENEGRWLNRRFFTFNTLQRPYIILKWAQSSDGFFAPDDGTQLWLTSASSKKLVHRWRTEESALLVGTNTAKVDNPRLTAREWSGKNPIRLVIDKDLKLSKTLHLFNDEAKTIIFNELETKVEGNIQYIQLDFNEYLSQFIAYQLYLMDIQSVLIEGGAFTLNKFIETGLWDEARVFTTSKVLDKGIKAPIIKFKPIETTTIEHDELNIYINPIK